MAEVTKRTIVMLKELYPDWGCQRLSDEPIEGRYASILAVKDFASRRHLAWLPVEEARAETVQAVKRLLVEHQVVPLYNPRRRPACNSGVERANGQLAGYQEALAAFRGSAGAPTCEDAANARNLANELARPEGW